MAPQQPKQVSWPERDPWPVPMPVAGRAPGCGNLETSKEKKGLPGREGAAQAGWAPLLVSALGETPSNGLARLARNLGTLTLESPEPHGAPGTETRLLLCCSAHPTVLLGTGRARLGCSRCRRLTVPVSPSLVWKTLTSPPTRAMQMENNRWTDGQLHLAPLSLSWLPEHLGRSGHPSASWRGAARTPPPQN